VSRVVDIPWSITVGNDVNLSEKRAARPLMAWFISWYISKLLKAARHDPVVTLAFMKVANLFAAPLSLLRPRLALRVLRGNFIPMGRDDERHEPERLLRRA